MQGPPPKKLGSYTVQNEIGRGGMGIVYKGYDSSKRPVAIKVLPPELASDKICVERFLREARVAAQLEHPNIIDIYDVGQKNKYYYFVMPCMPGPTLRQLLGDWKRFTPKEALAILGQLADALDYAHSQGLIHRDVKPDNVIFDEKGQAVLTDFGLARIIEGTTLTRTGAIIGTYSYMAPEQAQAQEVTTSIDQYALGIMAFEMLTGHAPFGPGRAEAILYKQVHEPPPRVYLFCTDLPPAIQAVLDRVLAKSPADRYSSCGEFVKALEQALLLVQPVIISPDYTERLAQLARLNVKRFQAIKKIQWLPDNNHLCIVSDNGVYFYDTSTLQQTQMIEVKKLRDASISSDGRMMASVLENGTVILQEIPSRRELHVLAGRSSELWKVVFSHDGELIAALPQGGGIKVKVWKASSGQKLRYFPSEQVDVLANVAFSPDGNKLAVGGILKGVRIWDMTSGRELSRFSIDSGICYMAFSPDGKIIASQTLGKTAEVRLWDVTSGLELFTISHGTSDITLFGSTVTFSPDGAMLALAFDDKILLWDMASKRELCTLSGCIGTVEHIAFSPDGTMLASASKDGIVRLWGVR
jgi:serine/threonine protein kinase